MTRKARKRLPSGRSQRRKRREGRVAECRGETKSRNRLRKRARERREPGTGPRQEPRRARVIIPTRLMKMVMRATLKVIATHGQPG